MFTGIVAVLGEIVEIKPSEGLVHFGVKTPQGFQSGLERGASVSVDGVCLTVLEQIDDTIYFDAMGETLRLTTIGSLVIDRRVNLERSLISGAEVGGHVVSGHVDGVAEIISIETPENNYVVTFRPPQHLMKFIFSKGFISLDGTSLTVVDADYSAGTFKVWFIPQTLSLTTFGFKKIGDHVNIEVDPQTRVIVETIERLNPALKK